MIVGEKIRSVDKERMIMRMRPWQRRCYDYIKREYYISQIHGPRIKIVNIWGPVIGKSWLIQRFQQDPRLDDYLVVNQDIDIDNEDDNENVDTRLSALINHTLIKSSFNNQMIVLVTQEPIRSEHYDFHIVFFTKEKEDID
jgi:hypothetical protein